MTSLQYHEKKTETVVILKGQLNIQLEIDTATAITPLIANNTILIFLILTFNIPNN